MTKIKHLFFFAALLMMTGLAYGQRPQAIHLEQIDGAFEQTSLELKAGQPYVFLVKNKGVDREVGFVIAPKGNTEQENHIQSAYLSKTIKDGEMSQSKEVKLEKGEYVYFCPLNPTPLYSITVK